MRYTHIAKGDELSEDSEWFGPAELIRIGGHRWQKGDADRVYFNDLHVWLGLEIPKADKYGGQKFNRLDGVPMQDRDAQKILQAAANTKVFFDVVAQKFRARAADDRPGMPVLSAEQIRTVVQRIKDQANGTATGSPVYASDPARIPGVSRGFGKSDQERQEARTAPQPAFDAEQDRAAVMTSYEQARNALNWVSMIEGGGCTCDPVASGEERCSGHCLAADEAKIGLWTAIEEAAEVISAAGHENTWATVELIQEWITVNRPEALAESMRLPSPVGTVALDELLESKGNSGETDRRNISGGRLARRVSAQAHRHRLGRGRNSKGHAKTDRG